MWRGVCRLREGPGSGGTRAGFADHGLSITLNAALARPSQQPNETVLSLPFWTRKVRHGEQRAEAGFAPRCLALEEVMALTIRPGSLSRKLLRGRRNRVESQASALRRSGAPSTRRPLQLRSHRLVACLLSVSRQVDRAGSQTWAQILAPALTTVWPWHSILTCKLEILERQSYEGCCEASSEMEYEMCTEQTYC